MIKKSNKGYSLVELIIVIAIIVVLSAMSLVSITLINTARCKDASTKFGDEVIALRKKSMDMTPGYSSGGVDYTKYGLVLYKESDNFKIAPADCGLKNNPLPGMTGKKYYAYELNESEAIVMSSRVDVKFKGTYTPIFASTTEETRNGSRPGTKNSTGAIGIMFDKHGNCISGYGEYLFYKKNGNQVARVIVKPNGSVEIR